MYFRINKFLFFDLLKLNAAAVVFAVLMTFILVVNINMANWMYFEVDVPGQNKTQQSGEPSLANLTHTMNPCQTGNTVVHRLTIHVSKC